MTPHPIDTMPADIAEEDLALLFCPEARRVFAAKEAKENERIVPGPGYGSER